jgi:hypothetical protein
MVCEHLRSLENDLDKSGIKETFRGKAWSNNCREWVYYDCILNLSQIRFYYRLPDCVKAHANDDPKSGAERGFVCELCQDAIMGLHPDFSKSDITFGDDLPGHL